METWKPVPIEEYYKDYPDLLLMWQALEVKEEKRVPWYSDEPMAHSEKADMSGVYRTNFWPKENRQHLALVAQAIGINQLPLDQDKAYKKVLRALKK